MEPWQKVIKNFLEKNRTKPLVVLLGPTASGKTALSLKIAKRFNGEIISADSRQVYRGMDIGTDKIPMEKREGIPHYLIDVVEPDQRFTVGDFKKLSEEKIDDILGRGKIPLLVGGTGLYIRALSENFQIPETGNDLTLRKELEEEAKREAMQQSNTDDQKIIEEKTAEILYRRLRSVDDRSASKIHPKNIRYILRALEIFYLTSQPKVDLRKPLKYKVLKIGLRPPLAVIDERIHRRVDEQFEKGLVSEVKRLLNRGFDEKLPSMQTIGYRELIRALRSEISLEKAREDIKMHTRQFARRQIIWFRKEKDIQWFL